MQHTHIHLHVINSASKRKKQHQKLNFLESSQHPAFPKLPLCWVNFQCQGLEGGRYHRGACRLPCSQRPPDWTRCTERSEGRERTEGSCETHGGHQKTKENFGSVAREPQICPRDTFSETDSATDGGPMMWRMFCGNMPYYWVVVSIFFGVHPWGK